MPGGRVAPCYDERRCVAGKILAIIGGLSVDWGERDEINHDIWNCLEDCAFSDGIGSYQKASGQRPMPDLVGPRAAPNVGITFVGPSYPRPDDSPGASVHFDWRHAGASSYTEYANLLGRAAFGQEAPQYFKWIAETAAAAGLDLDHVVITNVVKCSIVKGESLRQAKSQLTASDFAPFAMRCLPHLRARLASPNTPRLVVTLGTPPLQYTLEALTRLYQHTERVRRLNYDDQVLGVVPGPNFAQQLKLAAVVGLMYLTVGEYVVLPFYHPVGTWEKSHKKAAAAFLERLKRFVEESRAGRALVTRA